MEEPTSKHYDDYGNNYNNYSKNQETNWCLVQVEFDDHTYVAGTMYAELKDGKPMEPYKYYQKAEESDPNGSHTEYYPSVNKFLVIDVNDNLIRIVETSTCRSDDRIVYTIQNNEIVRIDEIYKCFRSRTIQYITNKVVGISSIGETFGIPPQMGDDAPTIGDILYNIPDLEENPEDVPTDSDILADQDIPDNHSD